MKVKTLVTVVVVIFTMALMLGCAKVPQAELDAAEAAMKAAQDAEVNRYMVPEFNAAKDSLNAAKAEIEKQNSKFALFRSYGRAKEMLANATNAFNAAKDAVAAKKEEVRKEAEDLLAQATPLVDEVKKLMKKAPRGKEGRAALEAMNSELAAVEGQLAEANTALAGGDYLTARAKAQAALQKLNSLAEELKEAIAKKKALSR